MSKNRYRGSSFNDFLKGEGLFEECTIEAVRRVVAFLLRRKLNKPSKIAK
jgi:hypothetical protein